MSVKEKRFFQAVGMSWKGNITKRDGKTVTCGHQHRSSRTAQPCADRMQRNKHLHGFCQTYRVREIVLRRMSRAGRSPERCSTAPLAAMASRYPDKAQRRAFVAGVEASRAKQAACENPYVTERRSPALRSAWARGWRMAEEYDHDFAIKDKLHGGYYKGATAIGPAMGATPSTAIRFRTSEEATRVLIGFPSQVLGKVVRLRKKEKEPCPSV